MKNLVLLDAKLSINWVYGYDGTREQTKAIYALSEHETLYVIRSWHRMELIL